MGLEKITGTWKCDICGAVLVNVGTDIPLFWRTGTINFSSHRVDFMACDECVKRANMSNRKTIANFFGLLVKSRNVVSGE